MGTSHRFGNHVIRFDVPNVKLPANDFAFTILINAISKRARTHTHTPGSKHVNTHGHTNCKKAKQKTREEKNRDYCENEVPWI